MYNVFLCNKICKSIEPTNHKQSIVSIYITVSIRYYLTLSIDFNIFSEKYILKGVETSCYLVCYLFCSVLFCLFHGWTFMAGHSMCHGCPRLNLSPHLDNRSFFKLLGSALFALLLSKLTALAQVRYMSWGTCSWKIVCAKWCWCPRPMNKHNFWGDDSQGDGAFSGRAMPDMSSSNFESFITVDICACYLAASSLCRAAVSRKASQTASIMHSLKLSKCVLSSLIS